jgi:multiple sugar transport system ATP-binding protein
MRLRGRDDARGVRAQPRCAGRRVQGARTETARLLEIENELDRRPRTLSGGQRQRVAIGRAIGREPRVFLMDEPLSNLNAKLRVETRANIASLQARLGTTTLYVTHDQVEAMTMGHRVAALHDVRLQQVDTPRNLYERPANVFVAGFIGSPAMNLRDATLATADEPSALALTVALVEELGADAYLDGAATKPWVVRCDGRDAPHVGDRVGVTVCTAEAHLFDRTTGLRLD